VVASTEPENDQPNERIGHFRYLVNAQMGDGGAGYSEGEDGHKGNEVNPGSTRRAGSGRYRPSLSSLASSSSSRETPYSSTAARVILSMPGAPLLLRTATHARHRTSLRQTLSYSA
jgi:hypothetical protein